MISETKPLLLRGGVAACACALLFSSCASPGDRVPLETAVVVPERWQQATTVTEPLDTAALPTWWTLFRDPVLDELVAGALHTSPDLHSALSRINEYRARRDLERAGLFPSLEAALSGGRTRIRDRATDITTTRGSYSASLDASWQVDLFGQQRKTLNAASADLARTQELYYGAQVSLAAEVASAYVALRSAEAQLALVQDSLGTRTETVQLTQWREQAGTGNALDTQQALATLESARASLPSLQLLIIQSRNQLTVLCGRVPGSLDLLLSTPGGIPTAAPALALGIPAEMLRQRPDVRAAERGLEAAYARTDAARRRRLPSLSISGSLGVEAASSGHPFNPDSTVASLLAGLTAPLLDAGRIRHSITVQHELEFQALDTYASTVMVAFSEVENALAALRTQAERLELLQRATHAAREAARLSALQYEAGQVDLFVSLDAQRTLLDLQQQELVTSANRADAYVQLYRSLGGGWKTL